MPLITDKNFKVCITEMYPQIPLESAECTLGITVIYGN